MSVSTPFSNGQNITLQKDKVITITNRTVRSGLEVYQTHNITGFGEGEVEIGSIPWFALIVLIIVGLIMSPFNSSVGTLMIMAAIAGGIWNFVKPKHYGFLMTLNSGDRKLFITTDKSGLRQVVSTIYEIIETNQEATYQISVSNSNIQGNFIQGSSFK